VPPGSGLERDPLAAGQDPIGLYVSGGVGVAVATGAVAGGLSMGGWPAVGCYTIAGIAGLYGGYVLALGVGWRLVSGALTRATTRSALREAASAGQRVLELRFRAGFDGSESEAGGIPDVDRIVDDVDAALGDGGDCSEAAGTGGDYRLLIRATDTETAVSAVHRVAERNPLPADSYLWIPDPRQPRLGTRLALGATAATPRSAAEDGDAVSHRRTPTPGNAGSRSSGFFHRLRESLSMEIEWMRMPQGHRALSKVHRSTDVVLRHFHEPLDLVDLELDPGPQAEQLLRFAIREVPPVDRHTDVSKLTVWLLVQSSAPAADVMLGRRRLGSTRLTPPAWQALTKEAERGIYADGLLEVAASPRTGRPVVRRLTCYLPRGNKS